VQGRRDGGVDSLEYLVSTWLEVLKGSLRWDGIHSAP